MTDRFIEPIARESTPSIIADKLRQAIGHGELKAGTQLGEAELARALGVSRGPLREGMQRLTQEGLLVAVRNRGVFVVEMTPANVKDMYVARTAVERAAVEQILHGDAWTAANTLLGVVTLMAEARERGDPNEVSNADIEFHELLVALAHSPRLTRMHKTLITETRMCIHALEETYGLSDVRVEEHRRIAEALRSGDAELTDRLLMAHMADALVRLSAEPSGD